MELMTIQETARLLKVSQVTVRRYIAVQRLPAVRVGRGLRVRKEDVENLPRVFSPNEASDFGPKRRRGKFSMGDSLWNLAGIARSDGAGDVSADVDKYLADAYTDNHATP